MLLTKCVNSQDFVNLVTEVKENSLSEGNDLIIRGIAGML